MIILANIAVPWLWQYEKIALITIGPAMLAEWLIVHRVARIDYLRSLAVTFLMNAVSTLVGFPVAIVLQGPMNIAGMGAIIFGGLAIACVITILVEWGVLHQIPATRNKSLRISVICNSVSYMIILLLILFAGYAMF